MVIWFPKTQIRERFELLQRHLTGNRLQNITWWVGRIFRHSIADEQSDFDKTEENGSDGVTYRNKAYARRTRVTYNNIPEGNPLLSIGVVRPLTCTIYDLFVC